MTTEERAYKYAEETYGIEDAFKSSMTNSRAAILGYIKGAEDERKILVERAWWYLAKKLEIVLLGNNGLMVLQCGINEEEFRKMMMEE